MGSPSLDAPELAVLAVLDDNIRQTIYALFAAHPELVSSDSLEVYRDVTPEAWLADAIYNHASALQYAIERYRGAVNRARRLRCASLGDENK